MLEILLSCKNTGSSFLIGGRNVDGAFKQKDAWKSELKDFSNKNGYDLNSNGDSGPLLLDVLEGFLKYEVFIFN
ncbi:hypothetical protein AgCh_012353 [Apium graveolens]